jgi:hypothetical protein
MHRVHTRPDTLDQDNRRFVQAPLARPLFLNSVPKSGSHLLQNVVRMFVPVAQQYTRDFIQHGNFAEHVRAFDPSLPLLSWGHLAFSDRAALHLASARKLLLVRDPYEWVVSRARFMVSDQFSGPLDHLKSDRLSAEQLFNLVIFGIHQKMPSLADYYIHNAAAWLGTDVTLVRYEELVAAVRAIDGLEGEATVIGLLKACGIDPPRDWRERVRIGADPARSGTARMHLSSAGPVIPDVLPAAQKALVDFALPGLRPLLGYGGER